MAESRAAGLRAPPQQRKTLKALIKAELDSRRTT
jgi:hypothetical protein